LYQSNLCAPIDLSYVDINFHIFISLCNGPKSFNQQEIVFRTPSTTNFSASFTPPTCNTSIVETEKTPESQYLQTSLKQQQKKLALSYFKNIENIQKRINLSFLDNNNDPDRLYMMNWPIKDKMQSKRKKKHSP
jgi:hypothetical protein